MMVGIFNSRYMMVADTLNIGTINEVSITHFAIMKSKEIMKTKIFSEEKLNVSFGKLQNWICRKARS